MGRTRTEIEAEREEVKKRLPTNPLDAMSNPQADADFARIGELNLELQSLEKETATTIQTQAQSMFNGRRSTLLTVPNVMPNLLLTMRK